MTYRESIGWLYGQQLHGIKLGLESMRRLCSALHLKLHSDERLGPRFVHVAGTNGKGSVCAMLAAMYRAAGLTTGLYTSPHLVSFRERIQVDGEMIPEEAVAEGLSRIRAVAKRRRWKPTFFEIVTALALHWYEEQRVDVVVLETGLGGRLDATNVVTPVVSVITPIDFDHERYLGDTLAQIAAEKAGIIKPEVPVIVARQRPEAAAVLARVAEEQGSLLAVANTALPDRVRLGLRGPHQRENAATALAAIGIAGVAMERLRVSREAVLTGLEKVEWPGRFQRIGRRIVLDGAHNPGAAAILATAWREEFGSAKATLIFGAMRDKKVEGVLAQLAPVAERIVTVGVANDRAFDPEELARLVRAKHRRLPVAAMADVSAALASARSGREPILIAGSLFLVGEALISLGLAEAAGERSEQ